MTTKMAALSPAHPAAQLARSKHGVRQLCLFLRWLPTWLGFGLCLQRTASICAALLNIILNMIGSSHEQRRRLHKQDACAT